MCIEYLKTAKLSKKLTPSTWIGEPKYKLITRIHMTCGGGIGGSSWEEYVERMEEFPTNKIIKVKRYDGKELFINTSYIVKTENFKLAKADLNISEWEAIRGGNNGFITNYVLIDDDKELELLK